MMGQGKENLSLLVINDPINAFQVFKFTLGLPLLLELGG